MDYHGQKPPNMPFKFIPLMLFILFLLLMLVTNGGTEWV